MDAVATSLTESLISNSVRECRQLNGAIMYPERNDGHFNYGGN